MELEIYRSSTKESSHVDRHEELCRNCGQEEINKGFHVSFDKHLSKFIITEDGVNFYDDDEINCSLCGNNFIGLPDEDILKQ